MTCDDHTPITPRTPPRVIGVTTCDPPTGEDHTGHTSPRVSGGRARHDHRQQLATLCQAITGPAFSALSWQALARVAADLDRLLTAEINRRQAQQHPAAAGEHR